MILVTRPVVPAFADPLHIHQASRIVAGQQLGIFLRDVKRLADPAGQCLKCLRLKFIQTASSPTALHRAPKLIQSRKQCLAVVQSSGVHRQFHVRPEIPLATRLERRKGRAQRAGDIKPAQLHDRVGRLRVHRLRMQPDVARHPRLRMTAARHTRVMPADLGVVGMFADDRLGIMRATLRGKRAHDGKFIIQLSQLLKRSAKGNARQPSRNLAGHAANARGRAHFGIKRLRL